MVMPDYDYKLLVIGLAIHLALVWYFLTGDNAQHTMNVADGITDLITGGLA